MYIIKYSNKETKDSYYISKIGHYVGFKGDLDQSRAIVYPTLKSVFKDLKTLNKRHSFDYYDFEIFFEFFATYYIS